VRVLGVDPGLTRCGIGVVDGGPGLPSRLVEVSVARTPSGSDLAERLLRVSAEIEAALERYRPDALAIERVFSQHNVLTVIGVAQATGVIALAAAKRGVPVAWHTPTEVKAAVSGNGLADKGQVTAMVTKLLRLSAPPKPADAADALALALCHLMRAPMLAQLALAERRAAEIQARATAERRTSRGRRPDSAATAKDRVS